MSSIAERARRGGNEDERRRRSAGTIDRSVARFACGDFSACEENTKRRGQPLQIGADQQCHLGWECNIEGGGYRPFKNFNEFDNDDVPSNSDVTLILTQYLEQAERYRSDNIVWENNMWTYKFDGEASGIEAARPSRTGSKK